MRCSSSALRHRARGIAAGVCAFAATIAIAPRPAAACGGCFVPPPQAAGKESVVTAHRMALSISSEQTILWDQIKYSGAPDEFAWVLPVKPGARIEVASDAWFDVLDAATTPQTYAPDLECSAPGFFGCGVAAAPVTSMGCGEGAAVGDGGEATNNPPVTVVSHGSAGPYETVILSADVPGALPAWLEQHGYAIPDDIHPLIDAYVAEGFDFVALRLLPAAGIQQMRPVRVVQSGAVTTLPLRMVTAGTGPFTEITLFVLGEGRYTTQNIPEVPFSDALLTWDFATASSNYGELRKMTLSQHGGAVFYAPFAEKGALFREILNEPAQQPMRFSTVNGWTFGTIAETYAEQAFLNGESSSTLCAEGFDAFADDKRRVVLRPCSPEGGCAAVDPATEIDARELMCDPPIGSNAPLDDMAEALVGMHPADVWLTRLEANLPRAALAQDLVLVPAPVQTPQKSIDQALIGSNPPATCEVSLAAPKAARTSGPRGGRLTVAIGLGAITILAMLRRSIRRRALQAKESRA
jgi:hypothetical protein